MSREQARRGWGRRAPLGRRTGLLMGLALTVLVANRFLLSLVGAFLIVADPLVPADALVPLAGDRSRVIYAAELFNEGSAAWFVVTDMWLGTAEPEVHYASMVQRQAVEHGVDVGRIVVPAGMPATTYDEIVGLRRLAEERGWRSLTVITSPSHTRRASLMFDDLFRDSGIAVRVIPVAGHPYRADSWWAYPEGRAETGLEYLKILIYLFGVH